VFGQPTTEPVRRLAAGRDVDLPESVTQQTRPIPPRRQPRPSWADGPRHDGDGQRDRVCRARSHEVRVITARSTQPGAASITALARGRVCGCAKGSCRRSACCGWHRPSARWMCIHKTLPVTPAMAAGITNWLWVCTEGRSYSYSGLSSRPALWSTRRERRWRSRARR
jgi:hypothetical protein